MADEMNSTCTDKAQDQTEQAVPDADTARMADTMAEDATAEDATAEGATEADTACDAQAGAADDADENGKLRGSERRRLKRAEAELAEANKKLEQAKQELATERDKYLRMLAEYDNFRRRTAKERRAFTPTPARTLSGSCCPSWTRWSVPWRIYPRKSRMTRSPRASG